MLDHGEEVGVAHSFEWFLAVGRYRRLLAKGLVKSDDLRSRSSLASQNCLRFLNVALAVAKQV